MIENESKLKATQTKEEPYEHKAYPKWLYSPEGKAVLVQSEGEHKAIVGVWAESPKDAETKARALADAKSKSNQEK